MTIVSNNFEHTAVVTRETEKLDLAVIRNTRFGPAELIISSYDQYGEETAGITLSPEEARLLLQHLQSPEVQALLSLSTVA